MGKFKVGDKVRLTEDYSKWVAGTESVIEQILAGDSGDDDLIYTDTVRGAFARRFELAAAWQPKVGDRVLVTDNITPGGSPIKKYEVGKEYTVTGTCKDSAGGHAVIPLGHNQYLRSDQFAPPAAPITITAGRYYKTRDGRKVGPLTAEGDNEHYPFRVPGGAYGKVYIRKDGTANIGMSERDSNLWDLIAEWVDEPVVQPAVAVAASNDNAAPAKPAKFKVGDRVYAEYGSVKGSGVVTNYVIYGENDKMHHFVKFDSGKEFWVYNDTIRAAPTTTPAIVALIESGKPKPATRPVVHASQEAATAEASRLALLHPGQEFGVFVLAGSKIADEVVTKTAVLRAS